MDGVFPLNQAEKAAGYIQTGLAVDPMTEENGCLLVVPGSHIDPVPFDRKVKQTNFGSGAVSTDILSTVGYSENDLLPLRADPGDIALWHVDTIHGSDENHSDVFDRCLFINGYVDARNCMRGQWAFINGKSIPLPPIDVPVLIQRGDIFDHLSFEYVDGPVKPRD